MASPEVLDFEKLLQPISEAEPAGRELKEDPTDSQLYYRVSDARRAAREAERQRREFEMSKQSDLNQSESPPAPPDWRSVLDLAVQVLAEHSKDLWVAAWLIEALTRLNGFTGLRDGFRLTRELCERFWDGIHPRPDEEEGYVHTVAQLTGLNGDDAEGALIAPILNIPLTEGKSLRPLSAADRERAEKMAEKPPAPDVLERRIQEGAVTLEMFDRESASTSLPWSQSLLEDIEQCQEEFSRMNAVLEQRCGLTPNGTSAAPPSSQIRNALDKCRDLVRGRFPASTPDKPGEDGTPSPSIPSAAAAGPAVASATGRITTREEGFRVLGLVAEFFRRTEPHSPISYHVEQAIRWGKMTLPDLWAELLPQEVRGDVFRRVGIAPPPEAEN